MYSFSYTLLRKIGFSKKDWVFLFIVCAVLLVLINITYFYGFSQSNDSQRFVGVLVNVNDQVTYLSYMEQVQQGNLLLTLLYSAADVPRSIINPFFVVMSFVSFLLPKIVVYHLFRNILAVTLVILLYYFIRFFIENKIHQRWVLLFLVFTSGWGFYLTLLYERIPAAFAERTFAELLVYTHFIDFLVPEAHIFFSMYLFPHFLA